METGNGRRLWAPAVKTTWGWPGDSAGLVPVQRCSLNDKNFVTMYRWHLPDPIGWRQQGRITIQQIAWKDGLAETRDDWSCATFWYEPVPGAALP